MTHIVSLNKKVKMASSNYLIILLLAFMICGCADDETVDEVDNSLYGEWYLREVLADPGDGSGTFQPTTQELKLTIFSSGIYLSSSPLCFTGNGLSGNFDVDEGKIYPSACDYTLYFEVKEGELYIYLPCIEPCAYKFRRN